MPTIKEIEVVNNQGESSSRDIGVEAQYVDVSKDALGNIVNKDEQVISESLTKILQKTDETGAKNLVKCNLPTGTNYTIDNLIGIINNDFTVTINGSLLEGNDFLINQNNQPIFTAFLPKGTYKLSGCPNGGGQNSYYLGIYIEGIGPIEQTIDIGEGMIFTLSVPSNIRVSSYCVTGYTFSNIVFKPMITLENEINNYDAYKEPSMSNEQLTREMNKIMQNEVILPSKGGTGVTSLAEARAEMGLGNSSGPLDIVHGGTGAETAGAARQALGLGGTALSGDGPLSFANGGTGSNNGRINDVLLFKEGNTYGYKDTDGVFHSFRQPTGNAVVGDVLSGKTFANASNDALTGTMPNRGAVSQSLNCGDSYTIPAGYHNGNGKVTANSLASQTGVDQGYHPIAHGFVMSTYQGWVNGSKITGSMKDYSGSSAPTVTPSGGTGNERIYFDQGRGGFCDNVIVNRTNPYNAGVSAAQATTWTERIYGVGSGAKDVSYFEASLGIPYKNVVKIKNVTGDNIIVEYRNSSGIQKRTLANNAEMTPPSDAIYYSGYPGYWVASRTLNNQSYSTVAIDVTFQTKILR